MAAEDYVGKPGHEKKFHKTHFSATGKKLKSTQPPKNEWVKVGVGKYILIRKVEHDAKKQS